MRFLRSSFVAIGLTILFGSVTAPVRADSSSAANIVVDTYSAYVTRTQGGLEISMHYEIDGDLGPCCDSGDVRWIQLVTSSTETGFTPDPNRPFIDPREGQNIGSSNGNDTPFYDVTYTDATYTTQKSDGSGSVAYDKPAVNLTRATPGVPYSFDAITLLVCVDEDQTMTILDGLEWGFYFDEQGEVSLKTQNEVGDTSGIRDVFNTALALDFPGWSIVERSEDCGCDGVRETPEPSSASLVVLGLFGISAFRRRRFVVL